LPILIGKTAVLFSEIYSMYMFFFFCLTRLYLLSMCKARIIIAMGSLWKSYLIRIITTRYVYMQGKIISNFGQPIRLNFFCASMFFLGNASSHRVLGVVKSSANILHDFVSVYIFANVKCQVYLWYCLPCKTECKVCGVQ
jgi:hypothetical protein